VTPVPEPLWSKFQAKYRPIAKASEMIAPVSNVVGVAAGADAAPKAAFIKAVIRGRRRAVAFMEQSSDEAGDIIAKAYELEPAVARSAVHNLVTSRTNGIAYWGNGQIYMDGLKRAIEIQKMVGAISGEVDAEKLVDTQFLPDDIKALK
jgi:NitT/TauT family transport system substrate-binding protein